MIDKYVNPSDHESQLKYINEKPKCEEELSKLRYAGDDRLDTIQNIYKKNVDKIKSDYDNCNSKSKTYIIYVIILLAIMLILIGAIFYFWWHSKDKK